MTRCRINPLKEALIRLLATLGTAAIAVLGCASIPDGPPVFTTAREVKSCKPLGEVLGESNFCSPSLARKSAYNQAKALGASHIVEINSRCVVFVGWKTNARAYDCTPTAASIHQKYSEQLSRIDLGMGRDDFLAVLPGAYVRGQNTIGGMVVTAFELEWRHTEDRLGSQIAERLWFYFHEDQLVKWGGPNDWPTPADFTIEHRIR
jgi:hypothetical protein